MNKSELVQGIAFNANISKRMAEKALDATLNTITNAMERGEKVQLIGFGTFEVKERAGRAGRNPKTNEVVMISPKRDPSFRAGKTLKNKVLNSKLLPS